MADIANVIDTDPATPEDKDEALRGEIRVILSAHIYSNQDHVAVRSCELLLEHFVG